MNQQETIAFWQSCETARGAALAAGKGEDEAHHAATAIWNSWAHTALARKTAIEEAAVQAAREGRPDEVSEDDARIWTDEADAAVDFSSARFVTRGEIKAQPEHPHAHEHQSRGEAADAKSLLLATSGANFDGWIFPGMARFDDTVFLSDARFGNARFLGEARFKAVQFRGLAIFEQAKFEKAAAFDGAQFLGDVWFRMAQFSGPADFPNAQFSAYAGFWDAVFSHRARFRDAKFLSSDVAPRFLQANFKGYTNFKNVLFRAGGEFQAIRSEAIFDLEGARFEVLPNFIQANFKEAPRLDHITLGRKVAPGSFWRSLFVKSSKDVTSRYRALKRLAIQGHDHEREYLFFKGELRSRRTSEERWWSSGYLLGVFYDLVSDFGRSVWRPTAAWALWAMALAGLYAISAQPPPPGASCGQPFWEGLYLAIRNGFPLGGARDQRITHGYSCLYAGPSPTAAGGFPDIPTWISYAELFHAMISVVLIFLIALAVRNQFKIK